VGALDAGVGLSSGFAVANGLGLRTAAPTAASAGVVQRVNMADAAVTRAARLTEAPVLPAEPGTNQPAFTRSLVALPNGNTIVSLSTSGFTVLPWDYDAAIADPRIESVVNAGDWSQNVAPGGLITVVGKNLSPINASTSQTPLPTLLGDSCLTVNGQLVPMVFVSPTQVNGQLPFNISAEATMILHTPSGVSNTFKFPVKSLAPGVFHVAVEGWTENVPTVYRASNNQIVTLSNPVHLDDFLVIYLTGMGPVAPDVATGDAGPLEPLAETSVKPEVTLGGTRLPVWYAGLTPGSVGVYQINVQVPFKDVRTGMEVPLTITQGEVSTTVMVRVVK
jgi:uncharacterized protein (TIGR03437 family)